MWIISQQGELSVLKWTILHKLKLSAHLQNYPHPQNSMKIKLSEETYQDKEKQNKNLAWGLSSCSGLQTAIFIF